MMPICWRFSNLDYLMTLRWLTTPDIQVEAAVLLRIEYD
jgi:hypothetical protein